MRRLYLVPIIHTGSDMGSMEPVLSGEGITFLGKELWEKHQEIVSKFWNSIAAFFDSLEVKNFRIYQDGLLADGEDGLRIVKESVEAGSVNYRIVSDLLQRGAILVKTEDISLVRKEHDYIKKLTEAGSPKDKEAAALRYKIAQRSLLVGRDNFIASTINKTLLENGTGVLFIGVAHNLLPLLDKDIKVVQVKGVARVGNYYSALLKRRRFDSYLKYMAEYLTSPVSEH